MTMNAKTKLLDLWFTEGTAFREFALEYDLWGWNSIFWQDWVFSLSVCAGDWEIELNIKNMKDLEDIIRLCSTTKNS